MDWIWSNCHGNLQDYINSCRKMKLELDAVNIKIKAELLSFSILGKLIDTSSSAHPYKITHYCANGKHNPNCTSHSKEQCFSKNPNLRLARRKNCRRFPSNILPSAHISSAQASALITGSLDLISSIKFIVDCGATHHMFNSRTLFSTLNRRLFKLFGSRRNGNGKFDMQRRNLIIKKLPLCTNTEL
ncbi:hypothetical protein O181_064314 [Austropuccinia psidii MF-1]|uniref:Uncharacterized protein n=1 Tax=Austropuccinia psidii MF-1 TaxID=1389203 RepID=A0A9Q3EP62_9BASI|nr:hypothetical protein [Austropuccinia psidii MF-1]